MDVDRPEEEQYKNQSSWTPATPLRPILPKSPLIFPGSQANPIVQRNWLGSGRFSQDQCFDASSQAEINVGFNLREAVLPAESCIGSETPGESLGDGVVRLNEFSCMDLLALADAASATSACVAAQGKYNATNSFSIPNSPFVGNEEDCNPTNNLVSNKIGSNSSTNRNSMEKGIQNKLPSSQQHGFDLYFAPAARMEDAFFSISTSQFAPETPEKGIRVERKNFAEAQNLCTRETTNKEVDEENAKSIAGWGNNEVQCDKQTPNSVTDSSIAAVSTPLKENYSPDKGGSNGIDLNETLQQKPTRKKHRPRVITEGKPRARRSVIPKPDITKDSPTGKRKYVRRTSLNKASEEKCKEPIDAKDMESTKKSCRRALDFDIEGQPQCKRPTCESTFNLESETRTQGVSTEGNQPKSTVHLGQGIEIFLGTAETGIAYDPTCSVNQTLKTLKDYISLPEKQVPSTPLPAKMKTPWRETNVRTQEAINNDREGQVAANKGPKNIIDTMLLTQAHLPPGTSNVSFCSTRTTCNGEGNAGASKRKYSKATEPAESSSTNLEGIHSNSVQAYQTKFSVHFPNIHKKKRSEKVQNSTTSSTSSSMTMEKQAVSERTRSENDAKGTPTASEANNWIFSHQEVSGEGKDAGALPNKLHTLEQIMTSSHVERKTKRRSRGPTRVRDFASLTKIMEFKMHPTSSARQETMVHDRPQVNSHRHHTCIEDLIAEMHATLARKKRTTKRNRLLNSAFSITHELRPYQKIALYNQHRSLGAPILWREMLSIDAIVERLKHLDINREGSCAEHQEQNALVPYGRRNQEHNALVLYRRDGTIVPFEGSFDPIKKRRPRPKVDLDEETNRVWKLLLQDINSEGIDGTDEDKEKWWEEERRVFRGRADSFIARMHLVQGDRRFSQWKGSVMDSVIGVFLTQNVSDHLSSSAFMSMASRFPKKSKDNYKSCHEEGTSSAIEEPSLCILGPKEPIQWNEISNQPISDQHSMTHHESECNEEKEAANSNEFLGSSCNVVCLTNEPNGKNFDSTKSCQEVAYDSETNRITTEIMRPGTTPHEGPDGTAPNDIHSSQDSTVSFCNSGDYLVAQNSERKELFSEISTGAENMTGKSLNGSTSFVELLQMAGSKTLHETYCHQISNENSKECIQPKTAENDDQRQKMENLDGPRSSLRMPMTPSSSYSLHPTPNSGVLEVDCFELFREGTLSSDLSEKDEHDNTNKSALTAESASQTVNQTIPTAYVPEAPQYAGKHDQSCNNIQKHNKMIIEPQSEIINEARMFVEVLAQAQNYETQSRLALPNISEALDVTESTATFDDRRNTQQITTEPDMNKWGDSTNKELDKKNAANMKAKSRRVGNEIKNDVKWEDLRKLAEASGKKRERTADTMDSVDWEAVRHADVSEIAQTIKERGMNNMLAERIKAFLHRVVREHGNIDLEWLRDVPPDKAKEYLLSVRGLGLKSVECVRLLTLHHLAFPVDTNVGRIAVRLGWVPLQPLPESLQLHLLELYPVQESIQKYLWPRLCKLDQRTLYELHYQMITFGKVFCTKNKPNCNACPMRGECRHFASAFASARLALPGPDEKSIVSRTDYRTPRAVANQEMLRLAQTTEKQLLGAVTGVNNCEPIIEEPATPEPECTQDPENDIEDTPCQDPDEIPTIKLNIEEFTQNLQNYMQQNMELQEGDISKALVALTAEVASIPTPKLKNVNQLRTEHQVYELPDSHPLLEGLEKRQPDDPCSYLLAIWTPGETADSFQPPESKCSSHEYGQLCHDSTCFSCNSTKEANAQIVRGTLLIPCRTAMRGSFPLNGTYFQVNEVFADHDSSLNPIDVPRAWIWNLPRRTVYFGTSIPTIFKGLTTEGIQHCFWRGYVCVRGFDQKTRAPRPLMARLHFPASKLRTKGKADVDDR
ncbi:protein ROS1 [Tripterygium wilfordii]|uniref:Protein ROS1 n=1 Tax=Tripterygium wilfordii TaxID=458696 RepID=A0A7J7CTR3_TRIWF|nr:transcriptional activator DEMETER-like [Tripterygium wilfordii]XP_038718742.1 transcriptional activator DEMETER-like [Tripterygium wilfordii]KAF5737483.1 protein ROS1 [Tripterygium wilfordii]